MKALTKVLFCVVSTTQAIFMLGAPLRNIDNMQEFDTMLTYAQTPMLVTFSASWCGVCSRIKEPFAQLMQDSLLKDKVLFVSIDFDKAKDLCTKYKVDRIPTFLYFKDGNVVRQDVGVKSGVDVKLFFQQSLRETFQLFAPGQQAYNQSSQLKSIVSSIAVPPLQYLKNGIDWCIKKLTV